jgi:hypothetical protein
MHVLPLLGRDTVCPPVSVLFDKDVLHVKAASVTRLMRVGNKVPNPAKCDRSLGSRLRFIGEYFSA